jgi:predicted metalloendopeptidase
MQSFRELLSQTDWIDEETKDMAAQKVNAMTLRIGYPDFILNPQLLNERYKDVSYYMYKYKSEISILRMNS